MSTKGLLQQKYHYLQTWLPKAEREVPVYQSFASNAGFTSKVQLLLSDNKHYTVFEGGPCSKKAAAEQEAASRALVHIMDLESVKPETSALHVHTTVDSMPIDDDDGGPVFIINMSHQKNPKIESSKKIRWHKTTPSAYSSDLHFGIHLAKLADAYIERDVIFYDPEHRISIEAQRELGLSTAQSIEDLERALNMIE